MRRALVSACAACLATATLGCTTLLGGDYVLEGEAGPGSGGGGASGPGSGGAGGSVPKPDLGSLTWSIENASDTPATISHDGVLVAGDQGRRWVVFSEPDDEMLSDQDIWVTERLGAEEWSPTRLTNAVETQYTYPSAVVLGDVVHVAFSGNKDGINDLFWVRSSGDLWLEPANLTASSKPAGTQHDFQPALAVSSEGQLAVAYLSGPDTIDVSLRVLRFNDSGVPQEPELGIAGGRCDYPAATFDPSGKLHVLATCNDVVSQVIHATDRSGRWQQAPMPDPPCASTPCTWTSWLGRPAIAVGPDGELHAVWPARNEDVPCAGGETSCDDILYARTVAGAFTEPAVVVAETADVREAHPTIAVDAHGRVLVAFHRFDDPDATVQFSWSADGVSFAPPTAAAPGGEGDRWFPASMLVDPPTQLPELALEAVIAGTDPLNTEIFRAASSE